MTNVLEKLKKTYFWTFWAHFVHVWMIKNFLKTLSCQFLGFITIYHHSKIHKKLKTEKNSKISDGKTDGQINGQTLMISLDPTFMGVQK